MILVLCDGSILVKSSGGADGIGSPQYGQLLIPASTGMPHVWQQTWLPSLQSPFTALGLKHMVPTSPLWARISPESISR